MVHHALADLDLRVGKRLVDAVLSIFEKSGATPVPLGTRATARLLGKSLWMTPGLPSIAASGSTTTGSGSCDDDRVGGIARGVAIGCDDDGDRLAGVTHDVDGHGMMRRRRERRADRHRREDLGDVGAGVDRVSTPSIFSAALVSIS